MEDAGPPRRTQATTEDTGGTEQKDGTWTSRCGKQSEGAFSLMLNFNSVLSVSSVVVFL